MLVGSRRREDQDVLAPRASKELRVERAPNLPLAASDQCQYTASRRHAPTLERDESTERSRPSRRERDGAYGACGVAKRRTIRPAASETSVASESETGRNPIPMNPWTWSS